MSRVLGHDQVHARFLDSLGRGKLHHAWLMHGPAGIGKGMLAFEMAREYLCERNRKTGQAGPACGECHACRMMAAGSHPDFLRVERERDESKKRLKRDVHIGQVRSLLSFLSLSGAESRRRVVLVDEAGRMNPQAANALLKGLEEPVAGGLLLMACEHVMALPATVRSRCLLLRMSPLPETECRLALQEMDLDIKVLDFAVRLAAGQPGKVQVLADNDVAVALLEWQTLTRDIGRADIGRMQDWISRHVQAIPHNLIVDVALDNLESTMHAGGALHAREALLKAAWNLAAWPVENIRRSLRPAPALLAHMLALRIALRDPGLETART